MEQISSTSKFYSNANSNNQEICSPEIKVQNYYKNEELQNQMLNLSRNSSGINKLLNPIPQDDDQSLPIVSIIVTIYSGVSYDNLFREVKQQAPEGRRVSLFSADLNSIDKLYSYLSGEEIPSNEDSKTEIEELMKEVKELEPDCVLFNFECCTGCDDNNFSFPKSKETMLLIKLLLDRGHMVMCSDFAVMALINGWDTDYLNANPFIILGECYDAIQLNFIPEVLAESGSEQLKVVGKVCSTGEAGINAMAGTVVFGVDPKKTDSSFVYDLSVLTIVTETSGFNISECEYLSTIGDKKGTCGHVMLKYNSGGVLFLSAGHWIELNNLNVDCSNIENIASDLGKQYKEEVDNVKNNSNLNETQKNIQYSKMANDWVKKNAPCKYSKKSNKNNY